MVGGWGSVAEVDDGAGAVLEAGFAARVLGCLLLLLPLLLLLWLLDGLAVGELLDEVFLLVLVLDWARWGSSANSGSCWRFGQHLRNAERRLLAWKERIGVDKTEKLTICSSLLSSSLTSPCGLGTLCLPVFFTLS